MLKVQTIVDELQDEIDKLQTRAALLEQAIERGTKIFGPEYPYPTVIPRSNNNESGAP